jgi:hypothetical protein
VFAAWLLEYLSAKNLRMSAFRRSDDGSSTPYRKEITLDSFRLNRICEDCNSGWMSRLEGRAKPVIKSLISGDAKLTSLDTERRRLLARWAGKIAIVETHAVGAECPVDGKVLEWMRTHEDREPGRFGAVACSFKLDAVGHLQIGIIRDLLGGGTIAGNIVAVALPSLVLICGFPLPDLTYECRCDLSVLHPPWPEAVAWKAMRGPLSTFSESDVGPDTLFTLAERIEMFHALR